MIATLAASARFRGACAAALALCMAGTTLAAPATPAELPRPELLLRWEGDAQVEGYRNIAKIFPTHAVARGAKTYELPRAKREIAPKYTLEKERGSVAEYMKNNRTAGLIVVKDGKIVLERYGLGQTDKSHWIAFSMAKSVTSTLLGAAIADGKIGSVDEQVVKYIPELRGSAYDGVTIEQVLQMRSGVAWNEDYADPNSDVGRLGAARGSDRGVALVETMATLKRAAEPGSRFNYSTGESNLIGVILKRAIDEPLASYLSRKVWQPFGMESDATWVTDQSGQEFGGCCVNATLRDYARLGLFAMQGGVANGSGSCRKAGSPRRRTPPRQTHGMAWDTAISGGYPRPAHSRRSVSLGNPSTSTRHATSSSRSRAPGRRRATRRVTNGSMRSARP
jgi:CubicO group peptidase (beta-lactamase class C family)